jgi:hypothetical protein
MGDDGMSVFTEYYYWNGELRIAILEGAKYNNMWDSIANSFGVEMGEYGCGVGPPNKFFEPLPKWFVVA